MVLSDLSPAPISIRKAMSPPRGRWVMDEKNTEPQVEGGSVQAFRSHPSSSSIRSAGYVLWTPSPWMMEAAARLTPFLWLARRGHDVITWKAVARGALSAFLHIHTGVRYAPTGRWPACPDLKNTSCEGCSGGGPGG